MHLFERTLLRQLEVWKSAPGRKPLILRGARQVGKTALVRAFGTRAFEARATIDFERQPDVKTIFERDLDPKRLLAELELVTRTPIEPGRTLLFFDEIQAAPRALMALRYFFEEMPALHVIAAGSLLEFALRDISFPVGRVSFAWLYPMSFTEFLSATGRVALTASMPRLTPTGAAPSPSNTAAKLLGQALREYLVVGGMPAAVARYVETGSFLKVEEVHAELTRAYLDDMPKYARGDKQLANLASVFRRIVRFVGSELTYSTLGDGDNGQRTAKSLELLEDAMLCRRIRAASPAGLPLGATASEKHFKCILLDVGLAQHLAGLRGEEALKASDVLSVYDGRIAEQFVGQQLLAESVSASEGRELYCWIRPQRTAKAEVDYLLARNGTVLPVEVKAGKGGRLRSLRALFDEFGNVKSALCLQDTMSVHTEGQLSYAPLYTIL